MCLQFLSDFISTLVLVHRQSHHSLLPFPAYVQWNEEEFSSCHELTPPSSCRVQTELTDKRGGGTDLSFREYRLFIFPFYKRPVK